MKRTFLSMMAAAALLSAGGCDRGTEAPSGNGTFPKSFYAVLDNGFAPATKVTFDAAKLNFTWEDGDQIVVNGATYKRDDRNNMFEYYAGGFTTVPDGTVTAYYPRSLYTGGTSSGSAGYSLPYTYVWDTGSRKVNFVPQAGIADENNVIQFKNLASLFRTELTNTSGAAVWVKSVTLSSDKPMSGDFTVAFTDGVPELSFVTDGTVYPSVEMEFDNVVKLESGESYSVYIPVPAQAYGTFNVKVMAYCAEGEGYDDIRFYNSSAIVGTGSGTDIVGSLTCQRAKLYGLDIKAGSFVRGVNGDGSSTSPYEVGGLDDLMYVQEMISNGSPAAVDHFITSYYKLTDDIVLDKAWTSTLSFTADQSTTGFSGVFDGDGHTIDATAATNTASIFWDINDGVIKNLVIKGDFVYDGSTGFRTWSPFFASALGDCAMVAVLFEGKVSGGSGTSYFTFGNWRGSCNIVGCYAKAQMGPATRYTVGEHQIFGAASPSYEGTAGATPWGVVADISTTSAPGTVTTYHTSAGRIATVTSMTDNEKVLELESAITDWNETLLQKLNSGRITQDQYNRKMTRWTVAFMNDKYVLVDGTL